MSIESMKKIAIERMEKAFKLSFPSEQIEYENCEGDAYFMAIHYGIEYAVGMTMTGEVFFCKEIR